MATVSEAVLKVIVTDDSAENVKIEFNGGKVPVEAIIIALELVLEKLQKSPEEQEDRRNIN
jgi:hypothetical protein